MKRIYLVKVFHDVAAAFSDEEKAQNYMNTYLYALEGSTSIVSLPLDDEELIVDNPDPNNAELKADNDARKFAMAMSEKVEKQLREEIRLLIGKLSMCGGVLR